MPAIRSMGTTLHYGDTGRAPGDGAPVVALHGSASTGAQWRSLAGYLGGRHRVLTPDLAGYGGSGVPAGAAGIAAEAAFLDRLLAATGEPVHLVGHSFGGAVALAAAAARPASVRSLTLIEPAAFGLLGLAGGRDAELADEIRGLADAVASLAACGEPKAATAAFVDYWNGPGAWSRTSPRLRGLLCRCLDRLVANFAAIEAAAARPAALAAVACPVLVVIGLESPLPSMRASELLAETVPGARLAMIAGAGHMAPLTDPHVVDPMIGAFLARAEAARTPAAPALALAA